MRPFLNSYVAVKDADCHGDNLVPREPEILALLRIWWGDPIPASDAIGEAKRAGKKRCGRCCQYKAPTEFSTYRRKERDTEYLHTYCKHCRAEMDRTKRWSNVTPINPYPARLTSD